MITLLVFCDRVDVGDDVANPRRRADRDRRRGRAGAVAVEMTMVFAIATVVAAELARRKAWRTFAVQSAVWGVAAAIAGRTFPLHRRRDPRRENSDPDFRDARRGVLPDRLRPSRFRAPAVAGHSGSRCRGRGIYIAGGAAVVRTIILAAAAVVLAFIARRWNIAEAWQLAVVTLVLTGCR